MPCRSLESKTGVLRLLAVHRDPESYVGGSTPLNRASLRFSGDIDVFHDREERVVEAALNDGAVLEAAGYGVEWLRQLPAIYTAAVTKDTDGMRLNGSWTATFASSQRSRMKCSATFCIRSTWQ